VECRQHHHYHALQHRSCQVIEVRFVITRNIQKWRILFQLPTLPQLQISYNVGWLIFGLFKGTRSPAEVTYRLRWKEDHEWLIGKGFRRKRLWTVHVGGLKKPTNSLSQDTPQSGCSLTIYTAAVIVVLMNGNTFRSAEQTYITAQCGEKDMKSATSWMWRRWNKTTLFEPQKYSTRNSPVASRLRLRRFINCTGCAVSNGIWYDDYDKWLEIMWKQVYFKVLLGLRKTTNIFG